MGSKMKGVKVVGRIKRDGDWEYRGKMARCNEEGNVFKVGSWGLIVPGSDISVKGSGFRVQSSGFQVQGSGFRVQGEGFEVQDSGY